MPEEKHSKKSDTITLEKATVWKIATGILALIVIVMFLNKGGTTTAGNAPAPSAAANPSAQNPFPTQTVSMKTLAGNSPALGDATAPVTIVEFSDFQCPFCKSFFDQTEGQLISNYVKTGKVRFVYRNFPLVQIHVNAEKAAEAAECANQQGKFWEMHDLLFQKSQADGTNLDATSLKSYAVTLGLDATKFNTCLDSGSAAAKMQQDTQDGSAVGIQGTPGFIVGKTNGNSGQLIAGAYPYSAFQQVIAAQLQ